MRAIVVLLFSMVFGTSTAWAETNITINEPWIRDAAPGVSALAGYMEIENHGDTNIALVSASGSDFDSIMLHETITHSGVAAMVHRDQVEIPSQTKVTFKPGDLHLMLMRPKKTLAVGDKSTIDLIFSDGGKINTEFEVKKAVMKEGQAKHAPNNH